MLEKTEVMNKEEAEEIINKLKKNSKKTICLYRKFSKNLSEKYLKSKKMAVGSACTTDVFDKDNSDQDDESSERNNAIPPSFQRKHLFKSLLHDEQLKDNDDKAQVIIALGANKDGYCNSELLLEQAKKAILIFERMHSGVIGIWAFDNSTIHTALALDALNVKKMNMHSGRAQLKMRTTKWNGHDQEMVYPLNHSSNKKTTRSTKRYKKKLILYL
ncbi:hypothetical protein F8M41_014500 [Gigaspora margarita]|uniref:Uncharacterized protein n=1 Tax=Gigaspora margarita TaxID=4874 RepID=A0A8H3WXD4_GIGMA|nr:hypothetical protein F8M41_014500 [Gigaspora margarita]